LDDDFIDNLYADIVGSCVDNDVENIKPLQDRIVRITEKKAKALDWCLDGKIDEDEMRLMNEKYNKEIVGLKCRVAEINEQNNIVENAMNNISSTLEAMRKIANQEEATPELYSEIIDRVLLYKNHHRHIFQIHKRARMS